MEISDRTKRIIYLVLIIVIVIVLGHLAHHQLCKDDEEKMKQRPKMWMAVCVAVAVVLVVYIIYEYVLHGRNMSGQSAGQASPQATLTGQASPMGSAARMQASAGRAASPMPVNSPVTGLASSAASARVGTGPASLVTSVPAQSQGVPTGLTPAGEIPDLGEFGKKRQAKPGQRVALGRKI